MRRLRGVCEDRLIRMYNSTSCRVAKCMFEVRQKSEG